MFDTLSLPSCEKIYFENRLFKRGHAGGFEVEGKEGEMNPESRTCRESTMRRPPHLGTRSGCTMAQLIMMQPLAPHHNFTRESTTNYFTPSHNPIESKLKNQKQNKELL